MAEETKKRAVRKPRATPEEKAQAASAAHDLIQAIDWIDVAQRDDNLRPIYEQHCVVRDGWIMAYDGIITAGHKIEQDGEFSPNTARLLSALVKSGDGLSLLYDPNRSILQVKSKKFRADVPCVPAGAVNIPLPEMAAWEVTDALLIAFKIALPITKQAPEVITSSLMVTGQGTVMSTDRKLFLEVYHGCAMYECILPRHFARIAANKEGLTHVGMSAGAITFWYGQDKFIRTQLYERDTWPPNPTELFANATHNGAEVPKDFATAVEAVYPHNDLGNVHCTGDAVLSARTAEEAAAAHECKGCPAGVAFGGKDLARALKLAATIEQDGDRGLFLYGEGFRGKLAAVAPPGEHMGSGEPPAAHAAFDAPPGFVLPGVVDPPAWQPPAARIDDNPYAPD